MNNFTLTKNMHSKAVCFLILTLFALQFFTMPASSNPSIESKQKETRAKIKQLKWLEVVESNKLYKNQQKLEKTEEVLNTSKHRHLNAAEKLNSLQYSLTEAQSNYNIQSYHAKTRIRQIYKNQRLGLLDAILSSNDINTFADRIFYQGLIVKNDKRNLFRAKKTAQRLSGIQQQIRLEKQVLEQSIRDINLQQKSIQQAIANNSSMIEKLRTDRSYYERTEKELARQSESLSKMINRSQSDSNSSIKVVSSFMKPIAGHITSHYGWRTHPIFKSRTFHSGIDIAGVNGAQIRAANSGKVIFSDWYGGYGKVIIIDHGVMNGVPMTTLYAHLSQFHVNNGTAVVKGRVIGIQGSTGYSTGPHLHFEVRQNGQPTNPLNYI